MIQGGVVDHDPCVSTYPSNVVGKLRGCKPKKMAPFGKGAGSIGRLLNGVEGVAHSLAATFAAFLPVGTLRTKFGTRGSRVPLPAEAFVRSLSQLKPIPFTS